MTEIPANTARPIGSTDSVLPGSWKGGGELEAAESAAEVPDGPVELGLSEGLGLPPAAFAGDGVLSVGEAEGVGVTVNAVGVPEPCSHC